MELLMGIFVRYNPESAAPTKNLLSHKTCNINNRNSFDFSYHNIKFHYIYDNPCPYPVQLHYLTPPLNNLVYHVIYPAKSITSQQAPKVPSVAHVVLPHASLFPVLLGTSDYTQLQETEQDCLGTIYDKPSEIMLKDESGV